MVWIQRLTRLATGSWRLLLVVISARARTSRERQETPRAARTAVVSAPSLAGPGAEPAESAGGVTVNGEFIHLPAPSIWPAVVALGVALLMFGFITGLVYTIAGALALILGLGGWIGDIHHG